MGRKPDAEAKVVLLYSGGGLAATPPLRGKAPTSSVFFGTALFVLGFVSLSEGGFLCAP